MLELYAPMELGGIIGFHLMVNGCIILHNNLGFVPLKNLLLV